MSQKILLQKATRIEGNAEIHIEVEQGRAKTARFMVRDFRGFEKFLEGKQVESAPLMVSRICGLCCAAHQLAGFRAVEDALGAKVPASVDALRQVGVLGEWISSHALSYFFLTLPDELGASHGVFDLINKHPDLAKEAFFLRKTGNRILEIVGKRAVHPVAMGVGGFRVTHTREDLDEIRRLTLAVKERAAILIGTIGQREQEENKIPFPADQDVNFFIYDARPGQEEFRSFNRSGQKVETFDKNSFEDHVSEMRVDWSLAKFPYLTKLGFPQGIMLVGPLSRLFQEGGVLDDPDLSVFKVTDKLRRPAALSLDNVDVCRLLEIYWASKQILILLDGIDLSEIDKADVDLEASGKGIGVVEAPRGVLVHSYMVNRGVIERMRLFVATQFNNAYINMVLRDLADRHVNGESISALGQELLGRCVRAFDPCLTCATH
jgi:coenzyme F420-reducing hydrogenase alpha subunit